MKMNRILNASIPLILSAPLLLLAGCSENMLNRPPVASIQGSPGYHLAGQIIHLESGKVLQFDELIDRLQSQQVVFIGEVHDNPDHHLMETQLLQELMTRFGFVTVAMEFLERRQQEYIREYLLGVTTESEFLQKVDWRRTWGFDYHLYRPLFLEVRQQKGEVIGINAPREVVRKVARVGLGGLEPGERAQLATEIDLSNPLHREFVRSAYEEHRHGDLNDFDFFYQAQCAWEDTMAEAVAGLLKEGKKVVVFAGNGHILHKFGIPDRTIRRAPVPMSTIVLYPLSGPAYLERGMADYVWLSR